MTSFYGDQPHSALLKISTGEPNGAKHEIPCSFEAMDGKVLRLEVPERISLSAPVSVEYSDAMFLGEVVSCRSGSGGCWELDIKVDQILTGLQSLMRLRDQLLGESQATPAHVEVPVRRASVN